MVSLNDKMKNLDVWDVALTKLSVLTGVFFLLGIWTAFADWVSSVNYWIWFAIFIVVAIRPAYRFWIKK